MIAGGRRCAGGGRATRGKLPPSFHVDYKQFRKDIRQVLEADRNIPRADRKHLIKLASDLDKFEEKGGFPDGFEGDASVTYEAKNGALAEHAEFVHALVKEEKDKGWLESRFN